jgi:4-coumarate--CoA ligase
MPRFDLEKFCKLVQTHSASFAYIVPPVALLLSKHPLVDKYDLSSLKGMTCAAAPLTQDLIHTLYKRLRVPLTQVYGLSETSPCATVQPVEDAFQYPGSVGKLCSNMTAKVADLETGKEVPAGTEGELWFSGPNVFKGYLNNPSGTANAFTKDGYFKTGDVGYVDDEGNFYITDRVKELIKYKGFQVAPAQLEGLLIAHPSVNDAAVIGVYSVNKATELPRAYIVLADSVEKSEKTANEIAKWLEVKVSNYKKLRGGVRFLDVVPKSATGKILRRVLRDEAAKEINDKSKATMFKL